MGDLDLPSVLAKFAILGKIIWKKATPHPRNHAPSKARTLAIYFVNYVYPMFNKKLPTGKADLLLLSEETSFSFGFTPLRSSSLLLKNSNSLNSLLSYDSSPAALIISSFKLIFGGRFLFRRSLLRDFDEDEGSVFDDGSTNEDEGFSSCDCRPFSSALETTFTSELICEEGFCSVV